jgi:hypothetical protein
VVHLLADAQNASIGFTARDTTGAPAALDWGDSRVTTSKTEVRRSLTYQLRAPGAVRLGQFLLGSMRVERDFQYAGRTREPLDAPFILPELDSLAQRIATLPVEVLRPLLLRYGARDTAALRARLVPRIRVAPTHSDIAWRIEVTQVSFDGKYRLWIDVSGDARRSRAVLSGPTITLRPTGAGPIDLRIQIATDNPALSPLTRDAIFNDAFRRFVAERPGDRRLQREIAGFELLSSREKLMAGLPNFATYFGRDMLMTALLMEPVWSDSLPEFVIAAALAKLAPTGEVSHEEALGGQAIRENGIEYLRTGDTKILSELDRVRENYMMVDDDFQLPVVAARYFANPAVSAGRKIRFFVRWREPLLRNLAFVLRRAAPYAADPVATNLVSFRRLEDGWWHAGSWRDSRVGYAGGRFAMDVNVVWVPAALRGIGTIDSALRALALPGIPDAPAARAALDAWREAARHFGVALAPDEVASRVRARLAALPETERTHWEAVLARHGFPADTLKFLAISIDSLGQPIPVMSTDPAMLLLLETLAPEREAELLRPFLLPYPVGLLVEGLGPLAANDVYARPEVWEMFERDRYHSPRVVWGREVNVLLSALARRSQRAPLDSVLTQVERSGLSHAELWTYRIDGQELRPVRFATGTDVQLWNLTDLALQFLLR